MGREKVYQMNASTQLRRIANKIFGWDHQPESSGQAEKALRRWTAGKGISFVACYLTGPMDCQRANVPAGPSPRFGTEKMDGSFLPWPMAQLHYHPRRCE